MSLHVRPAVRTDAPALLAYVTTLAREPDIDILLEPDEIQFGIAEEEEFLNGYAEADNSTFLVAETDGTIVGTLSLDGGRFRSVRHAVALGISVARDHRNQGIGDALMANAVGWAADTGFIKRIELIVAVRNARAIRLYLRHGFEFEGRKRAAVCRLGVNHDAYLMAKVLP